MANDSAEDFAMKLMLPIAVFGVIIFGIVKCGEFAWKFVSDNIGSIIVPLICIMGCIIGGFIALKLISSRCPRLWKAVKIGFFIMVGLLILLTLLLLVFVAFA